MKYINLIIILLTIVGCELKETSKQNLDILMNEYGVNSYKYDSDSNILNMNPDKISEFAIFIINYSCEEIYDSIPMKWQKAEVFCNDYGCLFVTRPPSCKSIKTKIDTIYIKENKKSSEWDF